MRRFLWVLFVSTTLLFLLAVISIFDPENTDEKIASVIWAAVSAFIALRCLKSLRNKKSKNFSMQGEARNTSTTDKNRKKQDNNFNEENWKKITAALKEKEAATLPLTNKDANNEVEPDIATEAYKAALANRYINIADNEKVYQLEYEDRDGDLSKRDIKIIRVGNEDGRWYVYAFCYLRDDYRSFRFDRIAALSFDGNRIAEPQKYLFDLYFSSPEYKLGLLFESKTNELAILIFMAKADGAMRKNERDIIVEYIKSISDITDENIIHESLKPLQVDLSAFNKILKIAKQWTDENKTLLLEWVSKVYAVKKAHDPIEEGIFKKIQEALKVKSKVNNDSNI